MTDHAYLLRHALAVAKQSMDKGNLPFGCLLAGPDGNILLVGENTVVTDADAIAHCEINLVHQLKGKYEAAFLQQCTVYASTEPCPMCTGAIFWAGIGAVVFALSKETFHAIAGTVNPAHVLDMKAAALLQHGGRPVDVLGPLLEDEAATLYRQWLFIN